uniref:Homeobox domain-containing protein n=1 Tax=Globodera rostochiensis TaxID=31243 RepID=A0A914H785_GLORO
MWTMLSRAQLDRLEREFEQSHYPDAYLRDVLASRINLAELRVKVWFRNRRAKYRRQKRAGGLQHNVDGSCALCGPQVRAVRVNRRVKGKGHRRAVTGRPNTTRRRRGAAGGKRKSRRGFLRTKAVAADADK